MKEIKGAVFVDTGEIQSCFGFDITPVLKFLDGYSFVNGIAGIIFYADERDPESSIESPVPDGYDHYLYGLIGHNGFLSIRSNPYDPYKEKIRGFYVTPYLKIDGEYDAIHKFDYVFEFGCPETPERPGFAFSSVSGYESIAETGGAGISQNEENYETQILEYYNLNEVNKALSKYGLNEISECVKNKQINSNSQDQIASALSVEPVPQSDIYRLLKALVHLNYGGDMLDNLKLSKSSGIGEISRDLEGKGYNFDKKTLRKYLKNLPDQ